MQNNPLQVEEKSELELLRAVSQAMEILAPLQRKIAVENPALYDLYMKSIMKNLLELKTELSNDLFNA